MARYLIDLATREGQRISADAPERIGPRYWTVFADSVRDAVDKIKAQKSVFNEVTNEHLL